MGIVITSIVKSSYVKFWEPIDSISIVIKAHTNAKQTADPNNVGALRK